MQHFAEFWSKQTKVIFSLKHNVVDIFVDNALLLLMIMMPIVFLGIVILTHFTLRYIERNSNLLKSYLNNVFWKGIDPRIVFRYILRDETKLF